MNELQIFNNAEFGGIRGLEINDEPWFVGKDVAGALGYKNPQEAIRYHVGAEDKGVREFLTPGGRQKLPIINESGLYSLVLSSKLPTARKFKRWVTAEVLPALRRTGTYSTDPNKQALAEAKLNNSRARLAAIWLKIADKVPVPAYQQICTSKASAVLNGGAPVLPLPAVSEKTYSAEEVGAKLGISANRVGRIANQHNIKRPEYGIEVWDKSRSSNKQVTTWRYNDAGVQVLRELLDQDHKN